MKLKTNLHFHTADDMEHKIAYSTKEGIDRAAVLGFEILALTCHNRFAYSEEYANYAKSKNILLIPGIEIGIERGKFLKKEGMHVVILGCDKEAENIRTFEDLTNYKKNRNEVLVLAPHPFFPVFYGNCSLQKQMEKNIGLIDAIENSWFYSKMFNSNKKSEQAAKKYNLPFISTSDTHFFDYMDKSYAVVETKEKSQSAVFEAIKNKNFTNTTSPLSFIKDMLLKQGVSTLTNYR